MKYFVFRNYTVEPFFKGFDVVFSGYGDISYLDETADVYIWFYNMPYKPNNDIIVEEIKHYGELLDMVYSSINNDKYFIIFTMVSLYTIDYIMSNQNLENAVIEYNNKINALAIHPNIKIINLKKFFRPFCGEQLIDWKYFLISQIPINPKLIPHFNKWFCRQLEKLVMKRKKCIVLDLDNTLWSGILGEDGIDGIKMSGNYPGNVYHFFQNYLLELNRMGIILAICSKNNEADVLEVWENHPDMVLTREMFSACRINWQNKADNIKEIAMELNIGLDSIVFIDDEPTEREIVKQLLSEVCVPEFPVKPYMFPMFIKQLTDDYFETYALTIEDLTKTQQYKENAERNRQKEQFMNIDEYLRSLRIELKIEKLDGYNKIRFAQMTQKTNQFNLTTRRYNETEIQSFANRGGLVYGLRVKDKFGDNGLTGLIIVVIDNATAYIDTFLLSCRILGKGIENIFLSYIMIKLKNMGLSFVRATYIKTEKNAQVSKFYDNIEFVPVKICSNRTDYELILGDKNFSLSDIYTLEDICESELRRS